MDSHDPTLTDPTLIIVLLEIVVIQFLIIVSILSFYVIKKRKRSRMLASMLADVNKEMDSRKAMIALGLKGFKIDNSNELAGSMAKAEADYYAALADLLHRNDLKDQGRIRNAVNMLFAPLLSPARTESPAIPSPGKLVNEEPVIPNVDQAIDELLTDRDDTSAANPDFDLSKKDNIAEIPDTLLFDETDADDKRKHDQ